MSKAIIVGAMGCLAHAITSRLASAGIEAECREPLPEDAPPAAVTVPVVMREGSAHYIYITPPEPPAFRGYMGRKRRHK